MFWISKGRVACRSVLLACVLAVSGPAATADAPGSSLRVGLSYYQFDYQELLTLPLKSTEKGLLPGVSARLALEPRAGHWFLRGSFDFASAQAKYDGSTQAGKPLVEDNPHLLVNLDGTVGWIAFSGVALYSGLGGRYWRRGGSYSEEYSWFYLPLGLRLQLGLGRDFRLGLDASARFMFGGLIRVNLSELDSGFNNPLARLGSRIGYHLEVPLTCQVAAGWAVVLAPWFEYSAIGQSEYFAVTQNSKTVAAGFEPSSRTMQYGALAGLEVAL